MKKVVSETIDGSMKDILQLKTIDNSLEYSQMYDALEDTPRDFQTKLVDALNSLGETMQIPPPEAFNKVLCKSDDENEDVTKKLYNWWRAFFEVLGRCEKIPKERVQEFNQKIDNLMAEIMKAGDSEATDEEEPVMEASNDEDFGYQQATKEDEDKMLADMEFAIQHIGEIANKVKELVNFVNPYCGTGVNEGHVVKPGRYGIGDQVLYKGEECVVTDVDEDLRNDEEIYQVSKDSDKVRGLSFNDWATWDELEPIREFTEEEKSIMNSMNERGGDSEWSPMDSLIGLKESDEWSDGFKVGDKVVWIDPEYPDDPSDGWRVVDAPEDDGVEDLDAIYVIVNDETGSEAEVLASELRPAKMMNEAKVVVDANDVWEVLELLDDDVANKNLTDLINSHVRTEDEIMDAIDSYVEVNWHGKVKKQELDKLFTDWMYVIVDDLGLDVDKYRENGEFVDEGKPTSVELEGTDWKDLTEKLDANELADSIDGWEDHSKKLVVCDAYASGSEIVNVDVLTVTDKRDEVIKMVEEYLLGNVENWQVGDASEPRKDENGQFYTELILEPKYEEVAENNDEITDNGEMKDGEKQVTQGGDTKTLVTGSDNNKQKVNEMTIEQEIDDPWKLTELLWGQGRENLEDLLRANVVDENYLMQMLEDCDLHNLTSINDAFAFDFPSMLDTLGLDGKAWSQNLEIKRKDEYDSDED